MLWALRPISSSAGTPGRRAEGSGEERIGEDREGGWKVRSAKPVKSYTGWHQFGLFLKLAPRAPAIKKYQKVSAKYMEK